MKGSAELGLKKYDEAELAYKKAPGIDLETHKALHPDDFIATGTTATRYTGAASVDRGDCDARLLCRAYHGSPGTGGDAGGVRSDLL